MEGPDQQLVAVLELISEDIKRLRHLSDINRRPRGFSTDLIRYSKALLDMINHLKATEAEQTQAVKRLSNEELEALAREALSSVNK